MTVDIGLMIADLRRRVERIEAQSRLKSASLDDTALVVRDGTGSLRGIVGQQGDGTTAVTIVNGPPPPQPSAPIVMSVLGGVTASWDGLFTDGVLPLDWSRTEVHASPDDGFTPTALTLQSTIETAQGATVVVPTDDPVYVRLVARSTSGTASTPSAQTGPYGPTPVVAGELLDGVVTTVKLADDAVTNAKVAAGAIGSTEITDNAVTTPKIVAGAVQTAQLDTNAVNASKIAAGAVTTAKLDALAVTAEKIAANTITAAKLAAGSVDATALKADAITGKTITGGVINGAEFHSDDGAGGLVDIQHGTVTATAASGWSIELDPSQAHPTITWRNDLGVLAGEINGLGDSARPGLVVSSGPFTDGGITDWRWATQSGITVGGENGWRTARVRESDTNVMTGGFIGLWPARANFAVLDNATPGANTMIQVEPGLFTFDEGRMVIEPPVSSNSAFYVTAKSGHTGRLIRAQVNGVDQFVVTAAGAVGSAGTMTAPAFNATGAITAASVNATGAIAAGGALSGDTLAVTSTTWSTYTPTVSGGGTATYATRTGFYYKIGKIVYIHIYIACSAAGSGSTGISVTLPSIPYRGSADIRQYLPLYAGGILPGSNSATGGTGIANINPGGSGTDIDQLRSASDIQYRGTNLSNTATFTIQGWYREA
ncbi:hypothetical protein ACFVSX_32030 [Streptomyces rubiginosohelvolus]|uniref:hypothetical protein n=1 Tax=Streptomyces rubiginosohelvolus TaxID=67362 RepID=UPI0036DCFB73